jgi:hypothetical protein
MSSFAGHCNANGQCECNAGFSRNSSNGKCSQGSCTANTGMVQSDGGADYCMIEASCNGHGYELSCTQSYCYCYIDHLNTGTPVHMFKQQQPCPASLPSTWMDAAWKNECHF